MSMTLDEMIAHEAGLADSAKRRGYEKTMERHNQIVKCLIELRERRKQPEIIFCKDCKHKGTRNCVANAWTTIFGFGVKDDFYCGLAEGRTDG